MISQYAVIQLYGRLTLHRCCMSPLVADYTVMCLVFKYILLKNFRSLFIVIRADSTVKSYQRDCAAGADKISCCYNE